MNHTNASYKFYTRHLVGDCSRRKPESSSHTMIHWLCVLSGCTRQTGRQAGRKQDALRPGAAGGPRDIRISTQWRPHACVAESCTMHDLVYCHWQTLGISTKTQFPPMRILTQNNTKQSCIYSDWHQFSFAEDIEHTMLPGKL